MQPHVPSTHACPWVLFVQSPGRTHPHVPPRVHVVPLLLFEQFVHVPPLVPHELLPIAAHCPLLQQ
jgi:hypothetical protein